MVRIELEKKKATGEVEAKPDHFYRGDYLQKEDISTKLIEVKLIRSYIK